MVVGCAWWTKGPNLGSIKHVLLLGAQQLMHLEQDTPRQLMYADGLFSLSVSVLQSSVRAVLFKIRRARCGIKSTWRYYYAHIEKPDWPLVWRNLLGTRCANVTPRLGGRPSEWRVEIAQQHVNRNWEEEATGIRRRWNLYESAWSYTRVKGLVQSRDSFVSGNTRDTNTVRSGAGDTAIGVCGFYSVTRRRLFVPARSNAKLNKGDLGVLVRFSLAYVVRSVLMCCLQNRTKLSLKKSYRV